ncbi:MAG TPA: hypothetical protein ACFYEF_07385 [Candidatus Wunengus sp. YC63]|uniref:hypothetical protein n=1 Tax=Candidatus Wunengus sp. YC63 TaxID=3367699 RepID=UPI0027136143|nr:hypothetical protein [Candidatus Brocadiales bacterium]
MQNESYLFSYFCALVASDTGKKRDNKNYIKDNEMIEENKEKVLILDFGEAVGSGLVS